MKVLLICNYKPGVGGISGQVEILQRKLRNEGHTADIFSTKGSVLWRLGLLCKLRKAARKYDVLHIHCCSGWGFLPAVVGVIVGRQLGKRVVMTYHGGGGDSFFANHSQLVRHYLMRTDANIVLSGFLANIFDKHRIPYVVIPNILEFDESNYQDRQVLHPRFICTRAHEPLYNIPCILRAFQIVTNEIPTATLTLVGNGSQHEELIKMARNMGLNNVVFTGRVDNNEIYRQLEKADILLSSPKVDNMPVSILEAMNAGLLVISSRVGGVPFIVENEHTGLLFDNDDSDKLAELMLWSIKNQALAKAIIQHGRQSVGKYSWANIKDKLYGTYGFSS